MESQPPPKDLSKTSCETLCKTGDSPADLVGALVRALCHDLAGPLGAIDNSLALLADTEPESEPESESDSQKGEAQEPVSLSALARQSTARALAQLAYYRLAYGAQGNAQGNVGGRTLCEVMTRYTVRRAGGPVSLDCHLPAELSAQASRAVLVALKIVLSCLPRGGEIRITCEPAGFFYTLTATTIMSLTDAPIASRHAMDFACLRQWGGHLRESTHTDTCARYFLILR